MELRQLDREHLVHENGLDAQRLLPWPSLNAPFEGSWCVIRAGTSSTAHAHHEHEIFIAVAGEATVRADGTERRVTAGDIVYFLPGERHQVVNDGNRDFEMYSVWWDADMTERFAGREPQGSDRR